MNPKLISCSIQTLDLSSNQNNPSSNKSISSTIETEKFLYLKPDTLYKNRRFLKAPALTYRGFVTHLLNRNKKNVSFLTLLTNTNFTENKKITQELPKISLSYDKKNLSKPNIVKNIKNENIYPSLFHKFKFKTNKNGVKKENLYFMKEKPSDIRNIHTKLMKKNKLNLMAKQKSELINYDYNNNKEENNKYNSYINLTDENMKSFENEYNNICKNKLTEKYLIAKEINNIGKKLSWLNNDNNNKNNENEEEDIKLKIQREKHKEINSTFFSKRLKIKEPILQINQISNIPVITKDLPLITNLWKKDMKKFCKFTLNGNESQNKKFLNDLLDVYD